jgi:hypothetical protein
MIVRSHQRTAPVPMKKSVWRDERDRQSQDFMLSLWRAHSGHLRTAATARSKRPLNVLSVAYLRCEGGRDLLIRRLPSQLKRPRGASLGAFFFGAANGGEPLLRRSSAERAIVEVAEARFATTCSE